MTSGPASPEDFQAQSGSAPQQSAPAQSAPATSHPPSRHSLPESEQPDADRYAATDDKEEQHSALISHPLPAPSVNTDPDTALEPSTSAWLAPEPSLELPTVRLVPSLLHTVAFGGLVFIGLISMAVFFGVVAGLHLFGITSLDKLQKEPLILIPSMAGAYFVAGLLCFPVFSVWWDRPFLDGIHLNWATARRYIIRLFLTGIGVGVLIQLISNYLPIPKELPIDEFFKTTSGVWVIAIFGVLVAPAFEELAFRGFLLPSMAATWHWLGHRIQGDPMPEIDPVTGKPRWSNAATIFAIITTSIPFMLIHADQLAHAWAPLVVLFAVSVVLCEVRLRTGSLAASIIVHSSYNFSIFATLFIATGGFRHLDKLKS